MLTAQNHLGPKIIKGDFLSFTKYDRTKADPFLLLLKPVWQNTTLGVKGVGKKCIKPFLTRPIYLIKSFPWSVCLVFKHFRSFGLRYKLVSGDFTL